MRAAALIALAAVACGRPAGSGGTGDAAPPVDAGPDSGTDAGGDAGIDAGPCPELAALVAHDAGAACVDLYEAALLRRTDAGETPWPFNQTIDALSAGEVRAVPAAGVPPQAYVSGVQADLACRASGKRLCTVTEWMAACQGPAGYLYPYGNTYQAGYCNEGRATNPVIDLFGPNATFDSTEMNDPRLDQLPNTVANGGAFTRCRSAAGAYDMHGNLHEWIDATTSAGHGIFKGGFFVDAKLNGPGCTYATTAHAKSYHDYSTGFRCCADPR